MPKPPWAASCTAGSSTWTDQRMSRSGLEILPTRLVGGDNRHGIRRLHGHVLSRKIACPGVMSQRYQLARCPTSKRRRGTIAKDFRDIRSGMRRSAPVTWTEFTTHDDGPLIAGLRPAAGRRFSCCTGAGAGFRLPPRSRRRARAGERRRLVPAARARAVRGGRAVHGGGRRRRRPSRA